MWCIPAPATIKLTSIPKTPEVTKILNDKKPTTESVWADQPWQIPVVQMYGRLAYKLEGMTDMINGDFMEDLSELLNSAVSIFNKDGWRPNGLSPNHIIASQQTLCLVPP
jgi:hypothetical protein